MAKNVKWLIYFGSNQGTEYKIEIYDEYSGSPIELYAGESPIVTSENESENVETSIRSSTGSIEVCTKLPAESAAVLGKDMITIEDMLPQDNADRCVVLSHRNGVAWVVDWQGFVSCEVYNQEYEACPQNLQIPIISIVEALDSIKLTTTDITWYITIKKAIRMGLQNVTNAAGITLFNNIFFPEVNCGILNKYIDPSILVDMSLHDNENKVDYIENGNSYKTIIENICNLMGWCVREYGKNLYFMPINHNDGDAVRMACETYAHFVLRDNFSPDSYSNLTTVNMSSLSWYGTGHAKSIYQGKTFVEIIANIKKYAAYLNLPSFPRGVLTRATYDYGMYVCDNYDYSQFIDHRCVHIDWSLTQNQSHISQRLVTTNLVDTYDMANQYLLQTNYFAVLDLYRYFFNLFVMRTNIYNNFQYYCMSFFAKWKSFGTWEGDVYTAGSDIDGLVLYGIPDRFMYQKGSDSVDPIFIPENRTGDGEDVYIYKQESQQIFFANTGVMKLKMSCPYYDYLSWMFYPTYPGESISIKGRQVNLLDSRRDEKAKISVAVQWGDKWYNGTEWQSSFTRFWAAFDEDGECEMDLDITAGITGRITLYLSPYMRGTYWREGYDAASHLNFDANYPVNAMILTDISLEYYAGDEDTLNDASTNNYFRILGTKFHDGLSIHTDIASYNLNKRSPSIIVDSYTQNGVNMMSTMYYNLTGGGTEERRPELDLLDRLSKWYGVVRRKLDLEVAHPTGAALPMMKIQADAANGYDGKLYVPVAEKRDWKTGQSTITCLEDSDGDE